MSLSFQKIRRNTKISQKLYKNESIFEIVDRKPRISAYSWPRLANAKDTFLE